ncbi:MAG: hypothetical protein B0D92_01365 [Spirochaeta sp. LUC14_002_19_P3]|nr:MAG: hypothetical protein B0D92_01365 [Spirochaeta sp. LUC14_002_19_P3]
MPSERSVKFKTLLLLFNVAVISILVVFIYGTLLLAEKDYTAFYRNWIWILTALFFIVIGFLNAYFIRRQQLFHLMENEDWLAVLDWIDKKYTDKPISKSLANLYISTAITIADLSAVKKFEARIRQGQPELLRYIGVALGIPVILNESRQAVFEYFTPLADDEKTYGRDWARWCRACAGGNEWNHELVLLLNSRDISIQLLSLNSLEQKIDGLKKEEIEQITSVRKILCPVFKGRNGLRMLRHSQENHQMALVMAQQTEEVMKSLMAEAASHTEGS